MKQVGVAVPRSDALEKVLGEAMFGADLQVTEPLHLKVVRSPKRHARIVKIELGPALKVPGVVRIFTARDIPGKNVIGPVIQDQPVLAWHKVRHVGEPIALVAAETEEAAAEAAHRVAVVYADLPSVISPEEALEACSPLVHEKGNLLSEFNVVKGDVQSGFEEADVIIEKTYQTTWNEHAYLEPDAGVAYIDAAGRVTVACPTQYVHYNQREVASVLALPLAKVRIIQCSTGGGFGGRADITVQCFLALAAFHLQKTIRIVYSQEEVFQSTSKRHPFIIRYKSGAKRDGTLIAVDVEILGDTGAYASFGSSVGVRSATHATGPYDVPHVRVRNRMAYTNNPWAGAMRGFGMSQVTFAHESQMDLLAETLGIDPLDIRLKNALRVGSTTATGQTLTASVGFEATLREVKRWTDRNVLPKIDKKNSHLRRGRGIGCMWYGIGSTAKPNPSTAQVEVYPNGECRLFIGASEIGQGSDTVFLQIVSEVLGILPKMIRLIRADTAFTPDAGITSSSRQTYVSGNAVLNAAENLKLEAINKTGELLAVDTDSLFFEKGKIRGKYKPNLCLSIKEVAKRYGRALKAEGSFNPETTRLDPDTGQGVPHATYAFATHLAEVDVNTETGQVTVCRVIACHDLGKAINPQSAIGQIFGGVTMGLGFALMEEFIPGETISLLNYLLPTSRDIPEIIPILIEEKEPTGPFGAKGLGEPAFIPAGAAILNAIAAAIGQRIYHLPASMERVMEAIQCSFPN